MGKHFYPDKALVLKVSQYNHYVDGSNHCQTRGKYRLFWFPRKRTRKQKTQKYQNKNTNLDFDSPRHATRVKSRADVYAVRLICSILAHPRNI